MKYKISKEIILRLIAYLAWYIPMVIFWSINDIPNVLMFLLYICHIITVIFAVISILFFKEPWAYIVNLLFLIPNLLSGILIVFMMCFVAPPLGIILAIFGIACHVYFLDEKMRVHFGFKRKI